MSWLIPRLTAQQAQSRFAELTEHVAQGGSAQEFVAPGLPIAAANPSGGRVASAQLIQEWRDEVLDRLAHHNTVPPAARARFGAETGQAIAEVIDPIPGDAAHDGTWAFLTLAVFPDLVLRRWGGSGSTADLPADRWLGRLAPGGGRDRSHLKISWRRWRVLGPLLLEEPILGEDELVQLFERTAIARNPRLLRACAREVLAHHAGGRMEFARALMKEVSYATGVRLLDVLGEEAMRQLIGALAGTATGGDASATAHLGNAMSTTPTPKQMPPEPASAEASPSPVLAPFDWSRVHIPDTPAPDDEPMSTAGELATVDTLLEAVAEPAIPIWRETEVDEVLALLRRDSPMQAAVIEFAREHGGIVARDELFAICDFEQGRQLKGFRRPISRAAAALAAEGSIREGLPELLLPSYGPGGVATGYQLAERSLSPDVRVSDSHR